MLSLVLSLYLFFNLLEVLLSFLNIRHLAKHGGVVPPGFAGKVDGALLVKMRDYTMAGSRLGLAATFFGMAVTIAFLFGGLLDLYNSWIVGLQLSPQLAAVLFFLLLAHGHTLINLPFALYTTFYIEKKYGFNRQTIGLFVADTLKELLLATVLNSILLWVAFLLVAGFPENWWLLTWLFFVVFSVVMIYLAPYVIEPLFNKFSPIADGELEGRIRELLARAGMTVSKVFTMDASRRSSHSNAYFSGIGHVKRIVLYDTLLAGNTSDEVLAILAHEAGHWKKKHIVKRLVVLEGLALVGSYLFFLLVKGDGLAELFGLAQPTIYAKLLLAAFVGSLAVFPLQPLLSYWSRVHERQADDFALALTGNPQAMAGALVKLGADNLANLHPHPWYAAFYYSHPPLVSRVARLLGRK
ncbi:MAG TPA: M48 family metallopeptidase [Deltaproteobacteria bacterium]|nr:M48 family metallopeptidase [Deltaproteobacteria bacterium]